MICCCSTCSRTRSRTASRWCRRSSDDGATWGDAVDMITDDDGYLILIADRVVVSASGRLIAPIADHGPAWTSDPVATGEAVCYLSDDQGRSWRRGRGDRCGRGRPHRHRPAGAGRRAARRRPPAHVQPHRVGQPVPVPLGLDDGETWTQPVPSDIRSPRSPASIKRIPSTDDLLLMWNDNYEPDHRSQGRRTPLTTAISADDGRTWRHRRVLEGDPNGHYCYTAMHFVAGRPGEGPAGLLRRRLPPERARHAAGHQRRGAVALRRRHDRRSAMIYDMRIYDVQPGAVPTYMARFGRSP